MAHWALSFTFNDFIRVAKKIFKFWKKYQAQQQQQQQQQHGQQGGYGGQQQPQQHGQSPYPAHAPQQQPWQSSPYPPAHGGKLHGGQQVAGGHGGGGYGAHDGPSTVSLARSLETLPSRQGRALNSLVCSPPAPSSSFLLPAPKKTKRRRERTGVGLSDADVVERWCRWRIVAGGNTLEPPRLTAALPSPPLPRPDRLRLSRPLLSHAHRPRPIRAPGPLFALSALPLVLLSTFATTPSRPFRHPRSPLPAETCTHNDPSGSFRPTYYGYLFRPRRNPYPIRRRLPALHIFHLVPPWLRPSRNVLHRLVGYLDDDGNLVVDVDDDGVEQNADMANAQNAHYVELRNQAIREGDLMGQCFEASRNAYSSGDGGRAHDLSMEGKQHQREKDRLNAEAAEWIYRENNKVQPPGSIDLHGLYVQEAIEYTEKGIADARQRGMPELRVIVGKGNHSPSHVAKIKPAIASLMERERLTAHLDPHNGGVLVVQLQGQGGGRNAGQFLREMEQSSQNDCVVM